MKHIASAQFGDISVREYARATRLTVKLAPQGEFVVTTPPRTPLFIIKRFLSSAQPRLQQMYDEYSQKHAYTADGVIGKSHYLVITRLGSVPNIRCAGTKIIATIPENTPLLSLDIQRMIRQKVIACLRKEAKSYLPRRLRYLAEAHGFSYASVAFTHAAGRWGSCSSRGTINLNIALMNLPFELIDYVLLHELSHTRHMDHSAAFWREVAAVDPQYKAHRHDLKKYSPHV